MKYKEISRKEKDEQRLRRVGEMTLTTAAHYIFCMYKSGMIGFH